MRWCVMRCSLADFLGGAGGCAPPPPQLHSCTPPTCFAPPNIYLHPPNIFAPYPRNYSMLNSINKQHMFLQIIRFYSFRPRLFWHFWCSQVHSRTLGDLFLRPQTPAAAPSASASRCLGRTPPTVLAPPQQHCSGSALGGVDRRCRPIIIILNYICNIITSRRDLRGKLAWVRHSQPRCVGN